MAYTPAYQVVLSAPFGYSATHPNQRCPADMKKVKKKKKNTTLFEYRKGGEGEL